jgi:hypothetical protein
MDVMTWELSHWNTGANVLLFCQIRSSSFPSATMGDLAFGVAVSVGFHHFNTH